MADFLLNNSYYQRSNIVKSYEIQRGKTLNNYWIGVERKDGKNWLINGRPISFDSKFNCQNQCYNMEILLSTQAYKRYLKKKNYFVCVSNDKWKLFSNDSTKECLAVCVIKAMRS
uniref:C-type lectin domain-containing protein n=1 Tax=Elaeophora elaphi TaxID=1147741 RepID=A0A0R3RMG6_9BILA